MNKLFNCNPELLLTILLLEVRYTITRLDLTTLQQLCNTGLFSPETSQSKPTWPTLDRPSVIGLNLMLYCYSLSREQGTHEHTDAGEMNG